MAAGVAAMAIPFFCLLAATAAGVPMVPRYAINASVGFAIAVPVAVWVFGPRNGLADVLLCLVLMVSFAVSGTNAIAAARGGFRHPYEGRSLLTAALQSGEPVAVVGLDFIHLQYYAPPDLQSAIYYPADSEAALRVLGFDTVDRGYLAAARWYPHLNVVEHRDFASRYDNFTVYGDGLFAWLPSALRADQAHVIEIGRERDTPVYKVRTSSAAEHQ
jgi:hypothetical protein